MLSGHPPFKLPPLLHMDHQELGSRQMDPIRMRAELAMSVEEDVEIVMKAARIESDQGRGHAGDLLRNTVGRWSGKPT